MPVKPLKFGCGVSIPSAVLFTWMFPSWATTPSSPALLEATQTPDRGAKISDKSTVVQAQNFPAPPPSDNLPLVPTPQTSPLQVPPALPPSTPEPSPTDASSRISVQKIEVTGSTILSESELSPIVETVEGRSVTLEQLTGVADAITQLYLDRGYITSRAILVSQTVTNGVVQIRVIEGSLERIEVEGTRRLNPDYVRSRIQLGAGTPLNPSQLEDQLRLLRTDPLFENLEASLKAGSRTGQSILMVRVTERNPIDAGISVDNYSPPSVGSERLGVYFRHGNLTGLGDELAASYYHTTTSGADTLDFSYRVPLNAMNGTLQLRAAPNWNHITQPPFNVFGIGGSSQLYDITYRQPIIRSPREEFALSVGFAYQNGQTFTFAGPTPFGFGPDANGVSRTSVIKFGQDYVRRDVRGAWSLRSQFSFGTGLLNATSNPDPIPDGHFFTWFGQVQRVQVLSPNNLLIVQADMQLTPDGLLPSQQFVIGGGQSLRGYRQNVRAGDNGVRLSIEDRITLQRNEAGESIFQLAPFFDMGTVWNVSDNPNTLQRQRFLAGVGMGLIWQPIPKLNLRLDYGVPLINLDDRGTNAQDRGFYFNVNYQL